MKKINLVSHANPNPTTLNSQWRTPTQTQNNPSAVDEYKKMSDNQALFGNTVTQTADTSQRGSVNQAMTAHKDMTKKQSRSVAIILFVAVLAGGATGWGAYRLRQKSTGNHSLNGSAIVQRVAEGVIKNGDVFGMQDSETFSDSAQGYLLAGGIDGEGSHRLLRVGGESQTVYLTSTVTDLDKLVGAEVKVWGETYSGQKAGWLMDVGKVEVIEVAGQPPFEEKL